MKRLTMMTVFALFTLSCTEEKPNSNPEPTPDNGWAPGECIAKVGSATLSYPQTAEGGGDDQGPRFGAYLCEHAQSAGTTVIAELLPGWQNLYEGVPLCDRNHAQSAMTVPVKVLGNVAGDPMPQQLDTTKVNLGQVSGEIYEGQTILLTIREDEGEWIWLAWVEVELNGTDVAPVEQSFGDLPTRFAELSTKLQEYHTDPDRKCGGETLEDRYGWPDYVRDPAIWSETCRPGYVAPDADDYPSRDSGN